MENNEKNTINHQLKIYGKVNEHPKLLLSLTQWERRELKKERKKEREREKKNRKDLMEWKQIEINVFSLIHKTISHKVCNDLVRTVGDLIASLF